MNVPSARAPGAATPKLCQRRGATTFDLMTTTSDPTIEQKRLVRHIVRALKATNRLMFWDIDIVEADILEHLTREMADGCESGEIMESVIQSLLMRHEDFLRDAVNDQCRHALRTALAKLPNAQVRNADPRHNTTTEG